MKQKYFLTHLAYDNFFSENDYHLYSKFIYNVSLIPLNYTTCDSDKPMNISGQEAGVQKEKSDECKNQMNIKHLTKL